MAPICDRLSCTRGSDFFVHKNVENHIFHQFTYKRAFKKLTNFKSGISKNNYTDLFRRAANE